jgi:hypothetical protein
MTVQIEKESEPLLFISNRIRFGVVISGNFDSVISTNNPTNDWKPFLEGNEIAAYEIGYSGRFINYDPSLLHRARTPDIFECKKLMLMRITGGQMPLKAAVDIDDYYNKESILNIILKQQYSYLYEYVAAIINSSMGNWYYRKKFTNDSKLTVNLSKEYVGQIPIKIVDARVGSLFSNLVWLVTDAKAVGKSGEAGFLIDLIDACVMECYFRDHMAERDLLFLDDLQPHLAPYDANDSEAKQAKFLDQLYQTLNAPESPIRNRLLRLTADSPDLLAVIKEEGKV